MAGTKAGGLLAAKKNKEQYGDDFYKKIGSLGGSKKSPLKGFGSMPREKRVEAGRRGGKKSRRG